VLRDHYIKLFDVDIEIISELIKIACFYLHILNVWEEKETIHVHVISEYEVCLWNKSRSGVPLTRKLLCTCQYGTPQHHRCRQKGVAACDTDWINNLSVNRVYTTAYWLLAAIAAKLWESDPGLSVNTYITPNPITDLWLNSAYRRKNAFI